MSQQTGRRKVIKANEITIFANRVIVRTDRRRTDRRTDRRRTDRRTDRRRTDCRRRRSDFCCRRRCFCRGFFF
ncbi:hypothetical protein FSZ17_05425 [Cytobacillus dafuensis]|uniref:Uncharacterized protein n=1 Tax=Cytobacillus dafuensis TaxID=1742359 RepID=A0A5B8Z3B0_CYTDA|nr:hypothetical protein FSZ17_05425 [Cytobacillus dafuensis]